METPTKEITTTEEKVEKQLQEFRPMPAFANSLVPKNMKEAMEMAAILAKSNVVPKDMVGRPESCFVAIGFGMELGLPPMQALQNIMVVNGRPSIWGDAALALVKASGYMKGFDEDAPDVALQQGYGRCRITTADGITTERRFSKDDAVRAKLWSKEGPWQTYPGRMLQMRARSWALRDGAPHVLKGIQFREEMADIEVIHPPVQMPKREKGPGIVQDATLVPGGGDTPKEGEIASPAPNQEAERGSQNGQPTGDIVNEGQEPGNAAGDTPTMEPTSKISEERRKALFKIRSDAKIGIADAKAEMKKRWGLDNTAELTNAQADELEEWFIKNPR